jgi:hypothetical protein
VSEATHKPVETTDDGEPPTAGPQRRQQAPVPTCPAQTRTHRSRPDLDLRGPDRGTDGRICSMGAWGRGGGEGEAKEGEEGGESKKGEGGTRGPVVRMGRRMWSPPSHLGDDARAFLRQPGHVSDLRLFKSN